MQEPRVVLEGTILPALSRNTCKKKHALLVLPLAFFLRVFVLLSNTHTHTPCRCCCFCCCCCDDDYYRRKEASRVPCMHAFSSTSSTPKLEATALSPASPLASPPPPFEMQAPYGKVAAPIDLLQHLQQAQRVQTSRTQVDKQNRGLAIGLSQIASPCYLHLQPYTSEARFIF